MEYIHFESQLCSEILIFKEKSNFGYTDHPALAASLTLARFHSLQEACRRQACIELR